jgi:hypothetical protein
VARSLLWIFGYSQIDEHCCSLHELGKYIDHLNHATLVLNPDLGSKSSSIREGKKRIKKKLRGIDASAILDDISLDS